jgi:hypothetical protein
LASEILAELAGHVFSGELRMDGVRQFGLRWNSRELQKATALQPRSSHLQVRIDPRDISTA